MENNETAKDLSNYTDLQLVYKAKRDYDNLSDCRDSQSELYKELSKRKLTAFAFPSEERQISNDAVTNSETDSAIKYKKAVKDASSLAFLLPQPLLKVGSLVKVGTRTIEASRISIFAFGKVTEVVVKSVRVREDRPPSRSVQYMLTCDSRPYEESDIVEVCLAPVQGSET